MSQMIMNARGRKAGQVIPVISDKDTICCTLPSERNTSFTFSESEDNKHFYLVNGSIDDAVRVRTHNMSRDRLQKSLHEIIDILSTSYERLKGKDIDIALKEDTQCLTLYRSFNDLVRNDFSALGYVKKAMDSFGLQQYGTILNKLKELEDARPKKRELNMPAADCLDHFLPRFEQAYNAFQQGIELLQRRLKTQEGGERYSAIIEEHTKSLGETVSFLNKVRDNPFLRYKLENVVGNNERSATEYDNPLKQMMKEYTFTFPIEKGPIYIQVMPMLTNTVH